ncbi:hypothetical protein FH972_001828 [Carpinus fangiana]|uniref:RNA uridylyltransferase n=1 Tax=Carpinus fangiana TaxID=176857 RepID=A0A5N6QG50_9ROSI|nr:hypothetical protein FH972_001828 [Carpinus fangiana]KAE7997173.1 hypothetical protein FH972_001828 [Carpinus fangiana]
MSNGGGDVPPPPATNGGEFLLSLLHKQQHHHQQRQTPPQQQSPTVDPAVAAVGPTLPFAPPPWSFNSNGPDLPFPLPPWPHSLSPPQPFPPNFLGFPQNPFPPPRNQHPGNQIPPNHSLFGDDSRRVGFPGIDARGNSRIDNFTVQQTHQEPKLKFGSFASEIRSPEVLSNVISQNSMDTTKFDIPKDGEAGLDNRSYNGLDRNWQFEPRVNSNSNSNSNSNAFRRANYDSREQERRGGELGKKNHSENYRSSPPPGFPSKPRGKGNWDSGNRRRGLEHNVDKQKACYLEFGSSDVSSDAEDERLRRLSMEGEKSGQLRLSGQLDRRGLPAGSSLPSVSALDIEKSISNLHSEIDEFGDGNSFQGRNKFKEDGSNELNDIGEQLVDSLLLEDESDGKNGASQHRTSREKDVRSDSRGQRLLSQRMRTFKLKIHCRIDIHRLNAPFLAIYESLVPAEEEKAQQKQLLALLERLVCKEWPKARLYLYGSCASSFGVSRSDIDVCLAIDGGDINKSEILLRLADILQSDNLQNVQALTRARVPIVKLMDPVTGISCDICINNVLAVINTKLLRDYAQIDARLRQLAFIVKHWAKSRGVNETYQGTLSSYAYVIMCIHFLQQRRPAILPCLQEMEPTYSVTVDDIECAFFDQVGKLCDFGSRNKETIAQLVWAFFNYWAYRHDYANSVISVRTGSIISKQEKDWTRRIGNDRHLICIEDPFEVSHDLGRVVDKYSIKVLREEFERAAGIMQYDPNPCVKLFEPYVHS